MGGLAESTRRWYCEQIKSAIRKNGGKASIAVILFELRKIPQHKYPVTEERVVSFLRYLRAIGEVTYTKSVKNKVSSKWEDRTC